MLIPSVANILFDEFPHRNQLRDETKQVSKGYPSSDNTTTNDGHVLHPWLLECSTQTQHQKINHCSHLEHAENLLMSLTETLQKGLFRKHLTHNELPTINSIVTKNAQQRHSLLEMTQEIGTTRCCQPHETNQPAL